MRRRAALSVLAFAACSLAGTRIDAQLVPNASWRTIHTPHFKVHFTPELEETARRAAVQAESAYARLASELVKPRGTIDLVIADNVDYSNGYATPFPTNRVVVYTHPPLDVLSLRFYDDWLALILTHELTHTFHLDRARGWWRIAQGIFGRVPYFMPNAYTPAWVTEGLATYYESRFTGAGRTHGSHQHMLVRAASLEGGLPHPTQWSLATSRYPGGEGAYAYGSLLFEHMADRLGPERVRDFVERSSGAMLPFMLNRVARQSFGISFESAWRQWRDSLRSTTAATAAPFPRWRELTHTGRVAFYPRWRDGSSLVYAANTGKETPGAYVVDTAGSVRRLARRNGVDINTPLSRDSLVFSQLEYVDAYHVRSDLYVAGPGGEKRLTHSARLAQADARVDGGIVAVRAVPSTTQLVRLSAEGGVIVPLTSASPDTQWASPRWSPDGDRIAATRWTRGGYADIVILDSLGRLLHEITRDRAFDSSPAWTPDGKSIVFSSDRTGVTELYIAGATTAQRTTSKTRSRAPKRVSRAGTGIFFPDVSPDGRSVAAVHFRADGWHVGVAPLDTSQADTAGVDRSFAAQPLAAAGRDASRAGRYAPWRTLLPRYWLPLVGSTTKSSYAYGAFTSGVDVIGRHSYYAEALFDPASGKSPEHDAYATYSYRGLGQPVLSVAASQSWDRFAINQGNVRAGDLRRRNRVVGLSGTIARPRVRSYSFATVAGELERRYHFSEPDTLIDFIDPFYSSNPQYRSVLFASGWTNARRPGLAISLEDGIAVSAAWRLRWISGEQGVNSNAITAAASGYKSLSWRGFAHHVLASRVAGGYATGNSAGEFSVGGISGSVVTVLPGVTVGARRTFGVRGFPAGARSGSRAVAGSLEYRAPLGMPSRGLAWLPVFLDRTSVSLFADAGAAWDPGSEGGVPFDSTILASAGAELILDAALQYDLPYRLRFGVAAPLVDNSLLRVDPVSFYVRIGSSF
ncbi:MAG: hypothetical protein ABR543_09100 [Gemmatimonadaceae bacterium]